jgi:DNA-binding MurR/RpiR family transcriptional regulator
MLKQIHVVENPSRYLKPPDIRRLRTNLARLKLVGSGSSGALAVLLQVEYQSLSDNARSHPCTLALAEVKAKSNQQCVVLSVSQRNHDSEALDFNSYIFAKKGNAIIQIKQPS